MLRQHTVSFETIPPIVWYKEHNDAQDNGNACALDMYSRYYFSFNKVDSVPAVSGTDLTNIPDVLDNAKCCIATCSPLLTRVKLI